MKKAHFQYIGYPRSGSTFLYRVFRQQAQLKECTNNFIKEFNCNNLAEYKQAYSKFDYSINMYTHPMILRKTEYLQLTNPVTDKFFVCIRNPYEAFSSSFALWNGIELPDTLKYNFADCANNLKIVKNVITKPFKIFYFEDLVNDHQNYINNVCNFLEIDTPIIDKSTILKHSSREVFHDINTIGTIHQVGGPLTIRGPSDIIPEYTFSESEIKHFNKKITELEQYLDRDFSHWKR